MPIFAVKAIAAALILAALAGAYFGWRGAQREIGREEVRVEWRQADAMAAEQQREDAKLRRQAASTASAGHEADRTATRTVFQTITERVTHEVEKPVYRNICIGSDGLQQLADAARATGYAGDPGQSGNPLPAASAPR